MEKKLKIYAVAMVFTLIQAAIVLSITAVIHGQDSAVYEAWRMNPVTGTFGASILSMLVIANVKIVESWG